MAKEEAARESRTKAEENILPGFLLIEVMSVVALSKECGGARKAMKTTWALLLKSESEGEMLGACRSMADPNRSFNYAGVDHHFNDHRPVWVSWLR